MRVEYLYRYPVKGLTAEALESAEVEQGGCIPWDRAFALAQGDSGFDPRGAGVAAEDEFHVPQAERENRRAGVGVRAAGRHADHPRRRTARRCRRTRCPRLGARRSAPSWWTFWARRRDRRKPPRPRSITSPAIRSRPAGEGGQPDQHRPACATTRPRSGRAAIAGGFAPMSGSAARRPGRNGTGSGRKSSSAARCCGCRRDRALPGDRGEPGNRRARRRSGVGVASALRPRRTWRLRDGDRGRTFRAW